jgi:hypothetical protein
METTGAVGPLPLQSASTMAVAQAKKMIIYRTVGLGSVTKTTSGLQKAFQESTQLEPEGEPISHNEIYLLLNGPVNMLRSEASGSLSSLFDEPEGNRPYDV